MILTIDFGTTVTKVGLWGEGGLAALARSELTTTHPQVGWSEQDPLRWWTTLVIACAEARAQAPEQATTSTSAKAPARPSSR